MFGEFVKERRIQKGLTLREFCRLISFDASNWSKIERNVLSPPQDEEKMKKIAQVLGIEIGSNNWDEFKDKSSIAAGVIPRDLLTDAEVVNALPLFFRTLRSEKPTSEELDNLIKIIKKEG